jgi:hypothetical protein
VVGFSTNDNKFQGSNPITGNLNGKIRKRITKICLCLYSTVVEHLTHDTKIMGLNPATDTGIGGKSIRM